MGEQTGIAWTDATFNPWWGCTKVSPACTHCYAATLDKRLGGEHWKPDGARKFFGDKHWNEPLRWDRAATKAGVRKRVFCASMADVFEARPDLVESRHRLWNLIANTPHLDWLLLTKRPENIATMVPWGPIAEFESFGAPWKNVWLGTTVENQEYADKRIPHLLGVPAAVHFLSCEPLLGPVVLQGESDGHARMYLRGVTGDDRINWVITGSESGPGRRDSDPDWYRMLRDQCAAMSTPFFLKQARQVGFGAADICETCRKVVRYYVHSPTLSDASCDCTVEGAESCATPPIGSGEGSWTKKDGTIEQPYLDGRQHIEFPIPRWQQV